MCTKNNENYNTNNKPKFLIKKLQINKIYVIKKTMFGIFIKYKITKLDFLIQCDSILDINFIITTK